MTQNIEAIQNRARIKDLLEKLRNKLSYFEVFNLQGHLLGRIKDFTLDKSRRLYMVIPQSDAQANSPVHLLSSQYIHKVDSLNKGVFVNLSLSDFQQLPLYHHSSDQVTQYPGDLSTNSTTQERMSHVNETSDIHQNEFSQKESLTKQQIEELEKQNVPEANKLPEVLAQNTIRLLEERLLISRSKRKVGEVVVRKQIETRFVEVPLQSEKLIVEKIDSASQTPIESEDVTVDQLSDHPKTEHSLESSVTQSNFTPAGEHLKSGETVPLSLEGEENTEVVEEEIIRLLEERLIVSRSKWKVGEVIFRKEIETEIVKVPLRREKLIIEQVGDHIKPLAEIDLATGEVTGIALTAEPVTESMQNSDLSSRNSDTVSGEFFSPKAASNLLDAIALQRHHGCAKVRIELVVEDSELRETYQTMFDRIVK